MTVGTATVAAVWALAVGAALAVTLQSLRTTEFDGLNNMLQIPLALPWFLLPVGSSNHELNAWVAAGMGWLNSALILLFGRLIWRRIAGSSRP